MMTSQMVVTILTSTRTIIRLIISVFLNLFKLVHPTTLSMLVLSLEFMCPCVMCVTLNSICLVAFCLSERSKLETCFK